MAEDHRSFTSTFGVPSSHPAPAPVLDPRGIAYNSPPPYLSTWDLAHELRVHPETVHRWCKRDWFGPLPAGRGGSKNGYRIPVEYRRIARVWMQTEDVRVRRVAQKALLEDPKSWVVVVDTVGSTHYSEGEAVGRVDSLLSVDSFRGKPLTVLYVGSE